MALLIATLMLLTCIGVVFAIGFAGASGGAERERASLRALAEAREALIAYAADHSINAVVGPGYLPCPDTDDDGWAEPTCGSQNGDSGQAERLGRLPWKTLGLDDLRDGHGERLWYAVSSKYKGLLNCGASRACLDMTPDAALGTISVRDNTGLILHDGSVAEAYRAEAGGAVAVVIAPGPPLAAQRRECAPPDCDARGRCVAEPPQRAARCNPASYLDRAGGARYGDEDNADFVDRNDAVGRALNRNGFIHGPVTLADGSIAVNDRLAVIAYRDVMPRIRLRVALEVSRCLRSYAARAENRGRYPWPTPACLQAAPSWEGRAGVHFGRIPDTPFTAADGMLERWWGAADFPTVNDACRIAMPPGDGGEEGRSAGIDANSWWSAWRPYVFYALAPGFAPGAGTPTCDGRECLGLADAGGRMIGAAKQHAVIVAGATLARDGFVQRRTGANVAEPRQWLEGANAELEGAAGCAPPPPFPCEGRGTCARVTAGSGAKGFNDVVVAYP
jgi:hypothetical protein